MAFVGARYAALVVRPVTPIRVGDWYGRLGGSGGTARRRREAPPVVREAVATAVGRRWTRWIWAEMVMAAAAGPVGGPLSFGVLVTLLHLWGAELAYVYGFDPHDPRVRRRLSRRLAVGLKAAVRWERPRRVRDVLSAPVLWQLVGLSRDQIWAARAIAEVRAGWRQDLAELVPRAPGAPTGDRRGVARNGSWYARPTGRWPHQAER